MFLVKKNNIENIVYDMPGHSSLLTFDVHNYCPVNIIGYVLRSLEICFYRKITLYFQEFFLLCFNNV